ncbi:hypothetical protein K440DRAFT_642525 [Wilcoxina mikolae CBS 423.85]|nr:hypothetical protein K440DRAFT_642525 [Wilcoxina mikolae CBS 423.85]
MTLCVISFDIGYGNLEVSSDTNHTEPQHPAFQNYTTLLPSDVDILRSQLRVSLQPNERGIFNLSSYNMTDEINPNFYPADQQWGEANRSPNVPNKRRYYDVEFVYQAIFLQTVAETSRDA